MAVQQRKVAFWSAARSFFKRSVLRTAIDNRVNREYRVYHS
jgi:hypothetical protein